MFQAVSLTLCGMIAYSAKCSHSMFRTQTTVKPLHARQENTLYSGLRPSLLVTQESTLYAQDPDHSEASPCDIEETARKIPQIYYTFHFELLLFFVFSGTFYFYIIPTSNYGAPQKTMTHSLRSWGLMDRREVNIGHCKYGCRTMNNCDLHRSPSFCWGKSTEQLLCVFQGFTLGLDFLRPNWPDLSPG